MFARMTVSQVELITAGRLFKRKISILGECESRLCRDFVEIARQSVKEED